MTLPRVFLLTNLLSPYRIPVWERLGAELDLVVGHLAFQEPGRPRWELPAGSPVQAVKVTSRALPVPGGEAPLYVASGLGPILRRFRPDAVVLGSWESPAYLQLLASARRRGAAVTLLYGSTLSSHRFRSGPVPAVRRWVVRRVDSVIAYGNAAAQSAVADGARADAVVTGFNTVDVGRIAADVTAARGRTAAPSTGHAFIYLGQLIERKNVGSLVRAFERIRQPGDTLTIVGAGPLETSIASLVDSLSLGESVSMPGHLEGDGLADRLAASQTLVLPSTTEVWGLTVNEALASGLHAVVSRHAGVAASVAGMPGVTVSGVSVEELATGMAQSRATWSGPIPAPPILSQTPEASAARHLEALKIALERGVGRAEPSTARGLS